MTTTRPTPRFARRFIVIAALAMGGCAATPSQLGITDPGVQLTAKGLATALQSTVKYRGACEIDVKGATEDHDTTIVTRCIGDARYDAEVMRQIRRVFDPETPDFSTAVWASGWDELLRAKLVQPRVATATRFAIAKQPAVADPVATAAVVTTAIESVVPSPAVPVAITETAPAAAATAESELAATDPAAPAELLAPSSVAVADAEVSHAKIEALAASAPVTTVAIAETVPPPAAAVPADGPLPAPELPAAPASAPLVEATVTTAGVNAPVTQAVELGPVVIDYAAILAAKNEAAAEPVLIPQLDALPPLTASIELMEALATLPVIPEISASPEIAPLPTMALAAPTIEPVALPSPELSPGVDLVAAAELAKMLAGEQGRWLVHLETAASAAAPVVAADEDLIGRVSTATVPAPETAPLHEVQAPAETRPPVGPAPAELAAAAALEKVRREWSRLSDSEQAKRLASLAYTRELPAGFTRTPIADDRRSTRLWGRRAIRGMTQISSPITTLCAVEYEVLALSPQTLDVADFNDPVFAADPLEIRVEPTRLDAQQNRARLVIVSRNPLPAI